MRWWCILCVSVLWRTVLSKAVKELDNVPEASGTRRCCPCPEDDTVGYPRSSLADRGFGPGFRSLAHPDQEAFGTSASSFRTLTSAVDDCPCRFRDADSTGSASVFFPTAMRNVKPFLSSANEKEETKPLLHPEVNLASSVLETLRQATDEEYEEALARDAARSVARAMEPDTVLEGARNLVSILVSPKQELVDDDHPELKKTYSHIPSLNNPNLLTDISNTPTRESANFMDMDVDASNTNENAVTVSPYDRLNLKPKMDLLNILPESSRLSKNQINIPKLTDILKQTLMFDPQSSASSITDRESNKNKVSSILDAIPKMNSDRYKTVDEMDDAINADSKHSPSEIIERYSGFANDRLNNVSEKSAGDSNSKKHIEAITALTDIKNKLLKTKIPQLKLIPENRDAASDLLTDIIKTLEDARKSLPLNFFNSQRKATAAENSDLENKKTVNSASESNVDKQHLTEIVDAVPSSSVTNTVECSSGGKDVNNSNEEAAFDPNTETEIVENVPSTANLDETADANAAASELNEMDSSIDPTSSESSVPKTENMNTDIFSKEDDFDVNNDINETTEDGDSNVGENFQSERENCSEQEDLNSADSNRSPNVMFENTDANSNVGDRDSEGFEQSSKISNDRGPVEDESKTMEIDENCENEPSTENVQHNNHKLPPLREKLKERLKNLKESKSLPKPSFQKATTKQDHHNSQQLSIDDLQKMSDSLLDQEKVLIDNLAERNRKTTGIKDIPSMDKVNSDVNSEAKDTDASESNNVSQITSTKVNDCLSDASSLKNPDFVRDDAKPTEMTSDASENVDSIVRPLNIPRSSLLPQIVQPSSLFDRPTNLFNIPSLNLPDIFGNPLPTLSIPKLFPERDSLNDDNNGLRTDKTVSNKELGMSPLASTSNSRSVLSPLEDINFDILQLKPLGLSQSSSLPMLPRLNLNSYKAKLAIPKSLPVKPVFLESSVTNKKGILGTSLSFGKEKNGILPKFNAKNAATEILGNPIVLPTFDDLRENFLENAQSLLSTPLETTGRNIIEDTFRSGQVLSENLKVEAKNAVSGLQKNLQSSLKGARLSSNNILGNPLSNSDFLDEISRRHEDFGDKLKGIHHDFSDRLETLRNNIRDQIPTLDPQMTRQSSIMKMSQQPLRSSNKNKKSKAPISRTKKLKTAQSSGKRKSSGMLPSPSMITPKLAEIPESNIKSPKLPDYKISPKDSSFVPKPATTMPKLNLYNRPLIDIFNKPQSSLRKPLLSPKLRENKVKITFETTPSPVQVNSQTTTSKPKYKSKPLLAKDPSPRKSSVRNKPLALKTFGDPNESPSEMKVIRTKAPLRIPIRSKPVTKPVNEVSKIEPVIESPSSTHNLDSTPLRSVEPNNEKTSKRPTITNNLLKASSTAGKSPSWPRIIDDSFLTKVREALKARLAGIDPDKHLSASKLSKAQPVSSDMARSASNAVEVVSPTAESLKENTSYSCQMVCKKN